MLASAQDLSSHQIHDENFLPLSTSDGVPHDAALGSLYSEAPVVRASVLAPRKYKKVGNGIYDEDDRIASIDNYGLVLPAQALGEGFSRSKK